MASSTEFKAKNIYSPSQGLIEKATITVKKGCITSIEKSSPRKKGKKADVHDFSMYNILIDVPLDVRAGRLYLPDRPGLGVELNPDALHRYEIAPEDRDKAGKGS